jgi:CIC family chloride channel protein
LHESKDQKPFEAITIEQVIEKDLLPIHPDARLKDLIELVKISNRNLIRVVDEYQNLEGIITLDDIREVMFDLEKQKTITIRELIQSPPKILLVNEKMQSEIEKFEGCRVWNLPVIEENKYLGFVSKARIFNAYRKCQINQKQD